ncbi:hypothetical protein ANN_06480 [Periplaneta americana]|uniref:Uncharacterized protein n=1 Tax=Periplaneta americana TaxID=6978 RepID=A0ABQ8TEI8_PERAM|nr:hypothetical protein ANN_06480 [Periplaneta americana]
MAGLCEGDKDPAGSLKAIFKENQSDSLMAADGDYHHLCKLMTPVRHGWSISDSIGGIRNTVMPSDCSALRFGIRSLRSRYNRRSDRRSSIPLIVVVVVDDDDDDDDDDDGFYYKRDWNTIRDWNVLSGTGMLYLQTY